MGAVADRVLVVLAIAGSACYAAYALGPKPLKRWLLALAASLLGRIAPTIAARAAAKAAAPVAGGCGGCGDCASGKAGGAAQAAGAAQPAGEIKIAVADIGRR